MKNEPDDPVWGLSPRRRGNRVPDARPGHLQGSIPAQAGEPLPLPRRVPLARVYPRAGGGTQFGQSGLASPRGLSPRRRGNLPALRPRRETLGSIPAQAGEPAAAMSFSPGMWVYPRAGGGTPARKCRGKRSTGLSPRRRGNRTFATCSAGPRGSIPAQAGEPKAESKGWCNKQVYPRAGGGTLNDVARISTHLGLSPRRRGNLYQSKC